MADRTQAVPPPAQAVPPPGTRYQNLSLGCCIAFGLILIAQVQVAGDGMWFWYAILLNSGKHLYTDMHLPLQPLYPLLIAWTMRFFGQGWIVSKLPAVIFMVAYALALRLIVRSVPGSDLQRGIALALGFSMPLLFEASRFDDYHVLTDTFTAWSVVVLIALARRLPVRTAAAGAAILGVLSGLAMVSRLNDGALLALTVGVTLLFVDRQHRPTKTVLFNTVLFTVVTASVVVGMVLMTGDSLQAWATNSIVRAASAKGGTGRVLVYPLRLAGNAVHQWFQNRGFGLLELYTAALCAAAVYLASSEGRRRAPWMRAALVVMAAVLFVPLLRHWGWAELPTAIADLAVIAAFAFSAVALVRAARSLSSRPNAALDAPQTSPGLPHTNSYAPHWNSLCLLVLLPLGQLVSGSMSSGGSFLPLTSPVGMFLVVLPIGFPGVVRPDWRRLSYTVILAAMALCCFAYKWQKPFHWHSYDAQPLFTGRQVYQHPVYGPMVIERNLLALVEPVCRAVQKHPDGGLLTLPFPYPNYFCATPPWHNYVQTFFDISTAQTVQQMIADLRTAPPAVVVYQRQIKNLESHEKLYNFGKPLPHRALDEFLGQKLQSGAWTATGQQCRNFSDWITIETDPSLPPSQSRPVPLDWNPYRCDRPD